MWFLVYSHRIPSLMVAVRILLTTVSLLLPYQYISYGKDLGEVSDCQPCMFAVSQDGPKLLLYFIVERSEPGTKCVKRIVIRNEGENKEIQSLTVSRMDPVGQDSTFLLLKKDINFDGLNDLIFRTTEGVANTYADHWLFDQVAGEFRSLGNFPWFKLDREKRRLSTYERGGNAGLLYESKEYEFVNQALVLIKSVSQKWVDKDQQYLLRLTSELRSGRLEVIKRETIKPPSPENRN